MTRFLLTECVSKLHLEFGGAPPGVVCFCLSFVYCFKVFFCFLLAGRVQACAQVYTHTRARACLQQARRPWRFRTSVALPRNSVRVSLAATSVDFTGRRHVNPRAASACKHANKKGLRTTHKTQISIHWIKFSLYIQYPQLTKNLLKHIIY